MEFTTGMNIKDPGSGSDLMEVLISPPEWRVYVEGPVEYAPVSFLPATGVNAPQCISDRN
jgi:hypothetical protein